MSLAIFLAAALAATTRSQAVVDVYRQACVDGQLKLTPERGELIDISRMPDAIRYSDSLAKPRKTLYIRMKEPSRAFVLIEQYVPGPWAKFETVCKVASRDLTEEDAQTAFFDGVANPKFTDNRDGGHPYEPFEIDQPQNGLRKRLFVKREWMVIETAIYWPAKQQK